MRLECLFEECYLILDLVSSQQLSAEEDALLYVLFTGKIFHTHLRLKIKEKISDLQSNWNYSSERLQNILRMRQQMKTNHGVLFSCSYCASAANKENCCSCCGNTSVITHISSFLLAGSMYRCWMSPAPLQLCFMHNWEVKPQNKLLRWNGSSRWRTLSTESQIQTQIMALLNENHSTCYGAIRSSWATFPTWKRSLNWRPIAHMLTGTFGTMRA